MFVRAPEEFKRLIISGAAVDPHQRATTAPLGNICEKQQRIETRRWGEPSTTESREDTSHQRVLHENMFYW